MINLLPQADKDELFLKRIKNLSLVLGAIVVIFLICLILILLSFKFFMLAEVDYQKYLLQTAQEKYETPDVKNYKAIIAKYNASLPIVVYFYKNEKFVSDILALLSQIQKSGGVHFTNIAIDEQNKITISGTSDTRENLIAFQKNLEGTAGIKNVSFSASSWISPTNNNFNITLGYGN